jgi:ketosteroid isomerase-like protein
MMLSRVRQKHESVLGAPQREDSSYREGRETPIPLSQEDVIIAYGNVTDEELAELIQRTAEAASAFIRGDMSRYLTLVKHADDYTLMAPFGGEPTRGFDASSERLEAMERYFQAGEARLELVQSYASGNIVVLVVIERQHGEVGGLPDQDWSLRVTLVYRRKGSEWQLVHRHADPLVHGMGLEQTAAIARG